MTDRPERPPGASAGRGPIERPDPEHQLRMSHLGSVFSVSSGMVGVCLTGIGLVKVVNQSSQVMTICDELIVLDAVMFSLAALLSYRSLYGLIRGRVRPLDGVVDTVFFLAMCLMVVICGVFAWSVF